jgi:outer membrane lipopolysaccharide assembly protein LptE/RlpB
MNKISTALLVAFIAFTLACGYSSKATTPATAGAMPSISQLSPNSATAGAAGFTMTVNGSNFASNSTVSWNGTALSTTSVSANQLMATVTAAQIANSGTVPVTVTNPATAGMGAYGSGGTTAETSTAVNFTVN